MSCSTSSSCFTDTTVDYKICTREGKDQNLGIRLIDSEGSYVPLISVSRVIFTARYGTKGSLVLQLDCTLDTVEDIAYIPFTADNTRDLAGSRPAQYKYDIEYEYSDGTIIPYLQGVWQVNPDVPSVLL